MIGQLFVRNLLGVKRMKARTDTQCANCIHRKVCNRLNSPINVVEAIVGFNPEDDNGIDIVVSCTDFIGEKPTTRPQIFKV